MLAQTISTVVGGVLTTVLGYFNPWLLLGTGLTSIGTGLFTTLEVNTGNPEWIGYQIIFGVGAGFFITAPLIAVQAVLSPAKTPVGIATVTFFQMFGGALFTALSQTVFNEQLLKALAKNVPNINIPALLAAGTVGISKVATPEQMPGVLQSFNTALMATFYLGAGASALAFVVSLGIPWTNVKGKNLAAGGAA